jgi:acetylornithine deacetylase/succinyl-diaminopimelate desuccinylase-like protein
MNLSLRTWVPVLGVVASALLVAGCAVEEQGTGPARGPAGAEVVVNDAPPPEQVEVAPPARVGYVWVRGHWQWNGGRYVWFRGHYDTVRPGRAWVEGHWERRPRGWVWVEGVWR